MENEPIKLLECKQYKKTSVSLMTSGATIIPNFLEPNYQNKPIESHIVDLPYPCNNNKY